MPHTRNDNEPKPDNESHTVAMSDSRIQDGAIAAKDPTGDARDTHASGTATSSSTDNDPPDWSMVPFSVACPRCGCDVHGRSDAVCPDCDLELDWSILAPVEDLTCPDCQYQLYGLTGQRCPECGREFDWDQVLEDYRRRQKPLFEFHWRQAPVRWLARAIWLAFRPWVLWRKIDIHDPTPTAGLALLGGLTLLASVAVPLLLVFPTRTLVDWLLSLGPPPAFRWTPMWRYTPWTTDWSFPTIFRVSAMAVVGLVSWFLGVYGGLLVLRQSMAQCKVRNGHVFRVCVYSFLPLASFLAIRYSLTAVSDVTLGVLAANPGAAGFRDAIGPILIVWRRGHGEPWLILALLALSTVSLALGYRWYIRMRHSWAVALSCSAIGFTTALIVLLQLRLRL